MAEDEEEDCRFLLLPLLAVKKDLPEISLLPLSSLLCRVVVLLEEHQHWLTALPSPFLHIQMSPRWCVLHVASKLPLCHRLHHRPHSSVLSWLDSRHLTSLCVCAPLEDQGEEKWVEVEEEVMVMMKTVERESVGACPDDSLARYLAGEEG